LTVHWLFYTKSFAMLRVWARRIVLAVLGAGAAGVLALWLEHSVPTELPAPTGTFALGRTSHTWDDISAWVWYPAAIAAPADDYLPSAIRTNWERERPAFINFLTRDLSSVRGHSAHGVAISNAEPHYPLVILRAGGSGSALNFTSLGEDLASHGYVVVGLDIATSANPEHCAGRNDDEDCATKIMAPLTGGIGRAIDHLQQLANSDERFKSKLDLTRVGVFGHSFGGAQAAQFCSQDTRCKAGINIDGRPFGTVISTGIPVPFMFLLSDHGTPKDVVSQRILSQIQAIYDRQPHDSRLRMVIHGSHHFTFSDDGALLKSAVFRGVLRVFAGLRINGRRQVEVTAYAVRTFFDEYLKGAADSRGMLATVPEIVVVR
jgi:predicted dienelactone hydrolase